MNSHDLVVVGIACCNRGVGVGSTSGGFYQFVLTGHRGCTIDLVLLRTFNLLPLNSHCTIGCAVDQSNNGLGQITSAADNVALFRVDIILSHSDHIVVVGVAGSDAGAAVGKAGGSGGLDELVGAGLGAGAIDLILVCTFNLIPGKLDITGGNAV